MVILDEQQQQTPQPLRFEQLAGCRVAVFEDALFRQQNGGNGGASLSIARQLATRKGNEGIDDAFSLVNLDVVLERFNQWSILLPRVKPFYAVKCNNDPVLLHLLASLGCGFDCASRGEIDQVVGKGLVNGGQVIYANPCKTRSYIHHADNMGVDLMTFDSLEELSKIIKIHSSPRLVLRISVADPTAQCPLATKFGCDPVHEGPQLLEAAKQMGVNIDGISFHVGSGCRDPTAFREAISAARTLFDIGRALGHRKMRLLDIGGGFPGTDGPEITFAQIARIVNQALDEFFPAQKMNIDDYGWPEDAYFENPQEEEEAVEIIAEPGRFFGSALVSLCANIIATTRVPASRVTNLPKEDHCEGQMLYVNDGVYGSFNCILFDHFQPRGRPLFDERVDNGAEGLEGEERPPQLATIVWGQTCDGLDQIEACTWMRKMRASDWLYYDQMGAYTSVAASNFNGFDSPQPFYAISQSTWNAFRGQDIVEEREESMNEPGEQ